MNNLFIYLKILIIFCITSQFLLVALCHSGRIKDDFYSTVKFQNFIRIKTLFDNSQFNLLEYKLYKLWA